MIGRRTVLKEDPILDLSGLSLNGLRVENGNFSKTNLRFCDLRGAYLLRANFSESFLDGANFEGAKLLEADLGAFGLDINFTAADLTRVRLEDSAFFNAYMVKTNLFQASLNRAHLVGHYMGADLREAEMRGADLSGANLVMATLNRADVKGAVFSPPAPGASLEGTALLEAKNLTANQLVGTQGDAFTLVDSDLRPPHWPEEASQSEREAWFKTGLPNRGRLER